MSRFVTTGATVPDASSTVPNRLEINDFVKHNEFFSLFILALTAMSSDRQENLTSFFQLGGIHGLPYVEWDGSGSKPVGSWQGYCTHGSMLFPTWHRPYVALFEQVIQQHAIQIASKYTVDQAKWKQAATDLRVPYWDWAANSVPPNEVIADKSVTITNSDGTRRSVPNPIFQYRFHPIDPSFGPPYNEWQTTLRHPTSDGPDATTDVQALRDQLSSAQDDITSKTYNLLTRVHTWPAFSNHTAEDGGSGSNSLEAVHDGIHDDVGGGGQMGDPSVAGFDPIFFLHHANVDRMLSLWSALNPGVWVSKGPAEGGTWTIPPNATIGPTTDLTPFWSSQSSYWVSAKTTATNELGYTYPEFNGLDMGNTDQVRQAIARIVNQLYGGFLFNTLASAAPVATAAKGISVSAAPVASGASAQQTGSGAPANFVQHSTPPNAGILPPLPVTEAGSAYYDWAARIHVQKYALHGSFSVLIFLGPVPEDPRKWRTSSSFVGAHHAFVNSVSAQCENCTRQEEANVVIEGFVHLNRAIARHSGLDSFNPSVVEPYLRRELSWRVQRANKTAVDVREVPSLEVVVCATQLSIEPGADLPSHGTPQYYPAITAGRPGGARDA